MQDKIIQSTHQGFMKGKLCLTSLIDVYSVITSSMDEERAVDVGYFDFSMSFHVIFYNILIGREVCCH